MRNCEGELGVVREVADIAEQGLLQWFEHMERMEEGHLVKTTLSDVRVITKGKTVNRMDGK